MSAWISQRRCQHDEVYRMHKILTHSVQPETSHLFFIRPGANDLGGADVWEWGFLLLLVSLSNIALEDLGGSHRPSARYVCLPALEIAWTEHENSLCVGRGLGPCVVCQLSRAPPTAAHLPYISVVLAGDFQAVVLLLCMVCLSRKTFHYRQTSTGMIAWGNDEAWWWLEMWSHNKWFND